MGQVKWPLFVTLTTANSPDPECIRTLRASWSKFRRRNLIAKRINGGISTIEVTEGAGGWHPHLHIVADCRWLALHVPPPSTRDSPAVIRQKCDHARLELSSTWAHVIGQPQAIVLAIRAKPGPALAYVLKYAVKGSDLIASKLPIAPLIRVLEKTRMLSAFGTMHGKLGEEDLISTAPRPCESCGEIGSLMPEDIALRIRSAR